MPSCNCQKVFSFSGDLEINWPLESQSPRCPSPVVPCPWPVDYSVLYPYLCENNGDPWRWAPGLGSPVNPASAAATTLPALFSLKCSAIDSPPDLLNWSSVEWIYARKRIDGGLTGVHVVVSCAWNFPGGSWTTTQFGVPQLYFSSMGIKVGQYPNTFFSFAGIPLANVVNRNQLAPDSGLVTYSFDVLAGNTDYACFSAGVETLTFGPSTFTLNVVVTPLP